MNTFSRHRFFFRKLQQIWPLIPAAIYLFGFLLIVLVYLVGLSFSANDHGVLIFPTLQVFKAVFAMGEFREALVNTLGFVVIGTPLELMVGLALALLLYQPFRNRGIVRSIFIIPIAVPALVTATLLFILFDFPGGHFNDLLMGKYAFFPAIIDVPLNWRGSKFLSLGISMIGKVWRDTPISMLILLAGLSAIDPELLDAAKTMGANFRQRLQRVIIPLILPSISAVVLLRSIEMWKEFIFPFVLAGRYHLLGTLIESLYNDWGSSNEAAVVALILVLCIVISGYCFLLVMDLIRKLLAIR
jgi:ABC-type sugar transport system permease subunit